MGAQSGNASCEAALLTLYHGSLQTFYVKFVSRLAVVT